MEDDCDLFITAVPVSVLFVMKQYNHYFLSFLTGNDIMGYSRNPGLSGSPVICDERKP